MSTIPKIRYDYGWGNPYFLLEILDNTYASSSFSMGSVQSMIYGPYEGIPGLIQETHRVIKLLTGLEYKHILITNGASNGINTILRHFKARGGNIVYTTKYGYPSYEGMIKGAGLVRTRDLNAAPLEIGAMPNQTIRLIDSPENPFGEHFTGGDAGADIWDAVYHNKIYTHKLYAMPSHRIHVGSYSKLLGVAGARVGFIAVNEPLLYDALVQESRNDLTGPSRPSQYYVLDILKKIDLDDFMTQGREYLCYNKEEFQKIEYLFDGQKVNEIGMFYCAKADDKALQLLDRVGASYVKLDNETIRLSMGQTKDIVKNGIRAILKGDGK
jgi:aspartate/methionine/tyrosine aminotransferase